MVRFFTLFAASGLALVAADVAAAPTRSADDYVCALSGKCGEQPDAEESKDAPQTKGFSMGVIRKSPGDQTVNAPATKGFTLGRRAATPTQTTRPVTGPSRSVQGAKPVSKAVRPVRTAARPTMRPALMAASKRIDMRLSFQNGSTDLTAQAREEAKAFAEAMKRPELASKRFVIEGHTDAVGVRAANMDLSQRRAAAVADYLSSLGVERSRIDTRGMGPDQPLAGKRKSDPANRRVEAELL